MKKVYNLTVNNFHTYFVGVSGVLGHNGCGNSWRGFEFRDINPNFPPNPKLVKEMKSSAMKNYCALYGTNCSEIAEDLFISAGRKGKILEMTPKIKNRQINTPLSNNKSEDFYYHQVYTDGKYIYDPRLSNNPIPQNDYIRLMKGISPNNINFKYITPEI